jgi:hypothetical protein
LATQILGKTANEALKAVELLKSDRCDVCGAQAYVLVQGTTGELMFCGHHYSGIMSSPSGKIAMESFAFNTVDDRDQLLKRNTEF